MTKIKCFLVSLALATILFPIQAQSIREIDDDEREGITLADSLAADTLDLDTLTTDSVAMRLPWPMSVKSHLDKLMKSKMLETSQVGLMVWDLDADSCLYRHNERQL